MIEHEHDILIRYKALLLQFRHFDLHMDGTGYWRFENSPLIHFRTATIEEAIDCMIEHLHDKT